jgi:stage II sporulation SpoAA-like protein
VPVHHKIDQAAGRIVLRFSGEITTREIFEYYSTLAADPLFLPNLAVLADCKEVTSVPTFDELGVVANTNPRARSVRAGVTRAAVVVSSPWLFGITRQFAVLAEPNGIQVVPFYDEHDAEQWLSSGPARTPAPQADG